MKTTPQQATGYHDLLLRDCFLIAIAVTLRQAAEYVCNNKASILSMRIPKIYFAIAGVILFIAFIFFSYLVAKEKFTQLDFDMTVKFQDRIPRRLDYPFSVLSILGRAEITMALWAILGVFLLIKRYWLAAFSLILLPIALAIEIFGKVFVLHPAPPYLFYRGVIKFDFPTDFVHTEYSYPSGHLTRTAFLVFFLMAYFHFRTSLKTQIIVQPLLAGFLVLMAISRIYLGEHWTSDVVGGTLIGISFGLLSGLFIPIKKHLSHKTANNI